MNLSNDDDKDEPFSVDIFNRRLRFSKPFLLVFLCHLYRWSIYIFIPFSIRLIPGIIAFSVILNMLRHPLDLVGTVVVVFLGLIGIVIPSALLVMWYRSIPWWFLNGTESDWKIIKNIAKENNHRFPDDFWRPFIYTEFGLEEDRFFDDEPLDSETDIIGFIGSCINISYKYKNILRVDQFDFYAECTYWELERYGIRFFGERMNVFVPYRTIRTVKRGLLWCNIILEFDTQSTLDANNVTWTEVCISIGHLPTMRGDRMLRDELFQRIAEKTAFFKSAC